MKKVLGISGLALTLATVCVFAEKAGTVNGKEISVEEANQALQVITKGTQQWNQLNDAEKKQLMTMMAPRVLTVETAKKELSKSEKNTAIVNYWMQTKIAEVQISDEEAKKQFEKMKKAAKKVKSKKKFPEFEAAKESIKVQLAQEKIVGEIIKSAKIKLK